MENNKINIPWKLKSKVFRVIDLFSVEKFLYFLQKYVTKRSRLEKQSVSENWIRHRKAIRKYGTNDVLFEFGAGKSLMQNLFLSPNVSEQIIVDLNPMLDLSLVEASRSFLSAKMTLPSNKPISKRSDLNDYGIDYRAPFDASDTGFPDKFIDVCVSTNTLEHIPKEALIKIFFELNRILKDSGIVSLVIDYSDHYSHTDSSIGPLNYLNYSESEWAKFNHDCHFQNRMRHYDYIEILKHCGFQIIEENSNYNSDEVDDNLKSKFSEVDERWSAISGYILARKMTVTN